METCGDNDAILMHYVYHFTQKVLIVSKKGFTSKIQLSKLSQLISLIKFAEFYRILIIRHCKERWT